MYDLLGALLILTGASSIATGLVYGAVQFALDLLT